MREQEKLNVRLEIETLIVLGHRLEALENLNTDKLYRRRTTRVANFNKIASSGSV